MQGVSKYFKITWMFMRYTYILTDTYSYIPLKSFGAGAFLDT